jgi:CDP-diacylglycerol--serine O-phosphatidyltransferase
MSAARPAKRQVGLNILPTSVTVLAICAGLTSIKSALAGRPDLAVVLLAAAAVLDLLDGRLARILDASSQMGKDIDSLADAIDFGVAPALVVYVSVLSTSPVGWIVVLNTREFFVRMPGPTGRYDTGTRPDSDRPAATTRQSTTAGVSREPTK